MFTNAAVFNDSLTNLGFEVKCFDDLKVEEVLQNISEGRELYTSLSIYRRYSMFDFLHHG